ncbi:MAG: permease [Rhodothermales bacterium]|nr:permease [Rhodothermales bacterium]MDG2015927.1 permease [Rhodothermales bacterium]
MLEQLTDWLVFNVFGFEADLAFAGVLHFFIYEAVKIGLLLLLVTHLMGAINLFFPIEKVRKLISSGKLRGFEYPAASLFGAVTPFCSCSSIPLLIGFLQGGIPIGVTFSFLITSPLVNEIALALFLAAFGVKVTLIYAFSGILLGTVLGWTLGRFDLERHLESWVRDLAKNKASDSLQSAMSMRDRVLHVSRDAMSIIKTIAPYVLAGVAIGAAIHGYVPTGYFEAYMGEGAGIWSVPLSVLIAVPMYANASAVIPIMQALVVKGIPLGTAIAFMMAVVGLSLPEALMLKKVMNVKLLSAYFGLVAGSIIILGYLFNSIF